MTHQACQPAARHVERRVVQRIGGTPCAAGIVQASPAVRRERERIVSMRNHARRRWGVGLATALVACGLFGAGPARAESVPIIIPPISSIVVGIPPVMPSLVVGLPGESGVNSRAGLTWS